MEQNIQLIARKAWLIVKVAYFLLRKNISKRKLLLLELKYLAMKRPKLAGNHHKNRHNLGGAYEFSCSNSPSYQNHFSFQLNHKKKTYKNHEECELDAVNRVLDMMLTVGNSQNDDLNDSVFPNSSVLPGFGFGQSPMVRQLRVTDSPYVLQNYEEEIGDCHVDEAAEEFIKRFYDQLHQQRITEA